MEEVKVGIVYHVQPEPPDPENCQWLEAGAVNFGLEYRVVDPERLAKAYAGSEEDLAEVEAHSPEGGFYGSGVSIHVVGAADGHEYLRFDAFDDDPHYHYVRPTGDHNHWVPFDPVAGGDMLAFTIRSLRERLGPMLSEAGGDEVAARLDPAEQGPPIDEVKRLAYEIRDRQRAAAAAGGGRR
ncbi:MAG: hypothetical protein JRH16_08340 [Deltaproteobacteria bacterium]|nr:hypothetical protein [Deltaproteobacteria bacterium]MBW2359967.1 hypothetical protein [Deltaproteobacteria bacterium]